MTPPLTIVTGFLGSGKTTLLRALLESGAGGRRLALVVNEFGQVGIDGAALARAGGAPLVELAGGCVCCEAGSDFLLAVEELIDRGPDQIVIEASGLAEPGGIIRRARGAGLPLDAVVAVAVCAGRPPSSRPGNGSASTAPGASWRSSRSPMRPRAGAPRPPVDVQIPEEYDDRGAGACGPLVDLYRGART